MSIITPRDIGLSTMDRGTEWWRWSPSRHRRPITIVTGGSRDLPTNSGVERTPHLPLADRRIQATILKER